MFIDDVMQQDFLKSRTRLDLIAERSSDSSSFIKSRAEEAFLHESRLVGALAASRLDKDAIASAILQNNAARDQPGQNKGP